MTRTGELDPVVGENDRLVGLIEGEPFENRMARHAQEVGYLRNGVHSFDTRLPLGRGRQPSGGFFNPGHNTYSRAEAQRR